MTRQTARDPYRGRDPRTIPAYTTFDAARYLRIPEQTIRNWAYGYPYATRISGAKVTDPLIDVEAGAEHDFSFFNLIELHVLSALRREHKVRMPKIRRAVEYLKKELGSARPLIDEDMETNGIDIFVTKYGSLINASQNGQLAMKALLTEHLKRIERDAHGVPIRLFPFTWMRSDRAPTTDAAQLAASQPRIVTMDPTVAFGRPVIVGSRVPTIEIYERFSAGESPDELAVDFGRTPAEVFEAIRCESNAAA
jgi:uncharacterized protein (DUF433 family)